jgi:hypothetical protein
MRDYKKDMAVNAGTRRPYTSPRLTVHGTVDQLTQAAGIGLTDTILTGSVVA